MKRHHLIVAVVLGSFFLAASVLTGAASAQARTVDVKTLEDAIVKQMADGNLVGLSVALVRDGISVLNKGYGRASLIPAAAAAADTPFAIGSITKQFTSACILLLAEEGKIGVRDPVARYYPSLTRANDITLLDLMNHVSGYPDYYPLDFVDRRMLDPTLPDDLIKTYAGGRLDFEPGRRYSYSNTGFIILGRVVEKVSGKSFGRFLKERILDPIGLKHTVYEPEPGTAGLAKGYTTFALSGPEPARPEAGGWIATAGALYSTAADLAAWDLALVSGRVLKPESLALMTTSRTLSDGRASGYGCGLGIGMRNGRTVYSHNGAVAGFYALNTVIPSLRAAVVLLSNFDNYDAVNEIYGRLMSAVIASDAPDVPVIAGPPAVEAQKSMFRSYQAGRVDRNLLGAEFDWYLTAEKMLGASARLKPYGEPARVELESVSERGGMEVSRVRFVFSSARFLKGVMYRTPDGKVQQFFVFQN